jgi:predicted RNase H-like nuclease
VVERPLERAADRAASHDNPLVPNAIERPVERAVGGERGERGQGAKQPPVVDRPFVDDGPGDRPGVIDTPSDLRRATTTAATSTDGTRHIDLFPDEELLGYRTRWDAIQTGFVDQPRAAVEQADALVSQVVTRLTEVFGRERSTLEGQWSKGDDVSTEDLRIALTRYRSFFHRLLSM